MGLPQETLANCGPRGQHCVETWGPLRQIMACWRVLNPWPTPLLSEWMRLMLSSRNGSEFRGARGRDSTRARATDRLSSPSAMLGCLTLYGICLGRVSGWRLGEHAMWPATARGRHVVLPARSVACADMTRVWRWLDPWSCSVLGGHGRSWEWEPQPLHSGLSGHRPNLPQAEHPASRAHTIVH